MAAKWIYDLKDKEYVAESWAALLLRLYIKPAPRTIKKDYNG